MVRLFLLMFFVMCLSALPVLAGTDLGGWRIIHISRADRVAVARSPEGELRLVRTGDRLGERTTITEFDGEQLILDQPGEWGRATLFVRVVDGRQQVTRRERQPLVHSVIAGDAAAIVSAPVGSVQ